MFSKASAAAAENVPAEESRRSRIQVLPLEVVVVLEGLAPKLTRKKSGASRGMGFSGAAGAGQAALAFKLVFLLFYWSLLGCFAPWNPEDAHKILHILYCRWYHV